jgi:hypothetical protein
MNPQEPQQQNYQPPTEPVQQNYQQPPAPQTIQPVVVGPPKKSHKKLALLLLIAPTTLFIFAILLMALSNLFFSVQMSETGDLFGQTPVGKTILNILIFLFSAIAFISWLPGLVIGIVLLVKQSK